MFHTASTDLREEGREGGREGGSEEMMVIRENNITVFF